MASVVIPTHSFDRLDRLELCLEAITDQHPDEVVVVVDSNPDLTRELETRFRGAAFVTAAVGRGVSAARNTGMEATSGESVVFVDDDVVPRPGCMAALEAALARPGIVGVGGRIEPDYEDPRTPVRPELLWLVGCTYAGHPRSGTISRPIGSVMGFRRDALHAVGGFPVAFGPSGGAKRSSNEELALSERIRSRYGPDCIWFAEDAVAGHWVPRARTGIRYLVGRCWVEGTSKADVRREAGSDVLGHDRSYVSHTLLPGLLGDLGSGHLGEAGRLALAGGVTAAAYAVRRILGGRKAAHDRRMGGAEMRAADAAGVLPWR